MRIPIIPKRDLCNNRNEIMLEAGITYHIVRYASPDILIVEIDVATEKAIPRPWLVECGALEAA